MSSSWKHKKADCENKQFVRWRHSIYGLAQRVEARQTRDEKKRKGSFSRNECAVSSATLFTTRKKQAGLPIRPITTSAPSANIYRKICVLGCVTRVLACARFTQPSPHIFLHFLTTEGVGNTCYLLRILMNKVSKR